jgi:hypothetical protein
MAKQNEFVSFCEEVEAVCRALVDVVGDGKPTGSVGARLDKLADKAADFATEPPVIIELEAALDKALA